MNIYRHQFIAVCPSDKASIRYTLQIEADFVIMAERIEQECTFDAPVYHEDVADKLLGRFGGKQTLTATHGKVEIETRRGS